MFHNRQKNLDTNIKITINDSQIERAKTTKFLGVILNENLKWNDHITNLHTKISKNLGVIRKVSHILPKTALKTLYFSLIHTYLTYCNIIWASKSTSQLQKLITVQKKAVRVITGAPWNSHSAPLFNTTKILKLLDINILQTYCFMYQHITSHLPTNFSDYFQTNSSIHQYNTRSSNKLHIQSCNTSSRQATIRFRGTSLWNNLANNLKTLPNIDIFKRKVKDYLLSNYV